MNGIKSTRLELQKRHTAEILFRRVNIPSIHTPRAPLVTLAKIQEIAKIHAFPVRFRGI